MATLTGSTVQNWYATLNYTYSTANNKLTLNINSIKITTLAAYTITSGQWNSANATYAVTLKNSNNEVLNTWSLGPQNWSITAGRSKTVSISSNTIIDAISTSQTFTLGISVVYNSRTSSKTTTLTLPAIPASIITFDQGTSNSTPPSAITTRGNWTVPNTMMNRASTSTSYATTTEVNSYDFRGWSTASNITNGNATYLLNTTYNRPTSNLTLYPAYLQLVTTYQSAIVNFDKGDVSSATNMPGQLRDDTSIIVGNNITFTIPNNIPTASNKVFIHWEDSNGRIYYPTDSIIAQSGLQITLYAKWVASTATLTFNATGGSSTSSASISYASTYPASNQALPVATRTGYSFLGWAKEIGGTVIWESNDVFKNANSRLNTEGEQVIPDGYTLYAIWNESYKTVTYDANGTTSEPAFLDNVPTSEDMYYSKNYYITDKIPIRAGYTFIGWNTNSAASTPSYYERDLFKNANVAGSNTTLYAIWRSNTSTNAEIIYNANGGDLKTIITPQTITYNNAAYISSIIPEKTGYNFQYWYSVSHDDEFLPGDEYKAANTPTIRTTLIAQWELKRNIYIGVDDKAEKISNIYIGDADGTAKSVIAIYIGDANGKAKKLL